MTLSFIDEKPQEVLLLALYDVKLRLLQWTESRDDVGAIFENVRKIKFQMQHLQLDNMTSVGMPVILAPSKVLLDKPDLTGDSILLKPRSSPFRQQEEEKKSDEAEELQEPPFI